MELRLQKVTAGECYLCEVLGCFGRQAVPVASVEEMESNELMQCLHHLIAFAQGKPDNWLLHGQ